MEFGTIDPCSLKLAERYVLSRLLLDTEPKPVSPARFPAAFSYYNNWTPSCQFKLERDTSELEQILIRLHIDVSIDKHAVSRAVLFNVIYRKCEEKIIMQHAVLKRKLSELASYYTIGNNSYFVNMESTS
ncbi:hypothetical protein ATL39_2673 [Sinobaca qinghaiensis]|uniref:Uncharacterized protein n=1 Tax=Sinobaca qinghaiensis TaxID=342944 RepID=A0A419V011_9BACL|nr:hypothetical protein [Sinobaca qinghaiensis]RKD71277.1 hypothetical protein ATL39_2673 [Sinobaca qinghaiensis]